MKRKIKVTLNGKTTEGEVNVRNTLHLEVQKTTRATIFRDRTKYTRKVKHKGEQDE